MHGFVYKIENKINGKVYIGQTTKTNPNKRKQEHFNSLKKINHPNPHLQFSFNKYGEDNFKFNIINWATSKDELDKQETYFINKYDSLNSEKGYNLRSGGSRGKFSLESRKRMSESHQGKHQGKYNPFYGKKHLPTTRIKMSKNSGVRKPHVRKKLSEIHKNRLKNPKNHNMYGKSNSWHGFRGCWYAGKSQAPWTRVWACSINYNQKDKYLGTFNDPLSAEIVYKFVKGEIYD